MNKVTTILASVLFAATMSQSVNAVDAPAKAAICAACHGAGGAKPIMDLYPKLAGQNKGYLVAVLKSYRSGERKGGQSALMVAQSSMLSDTDIDELAAYFSAQK